MSKSNGRVWPYAIGGAITLVFGFCVATIVVTSKADIQESDAYMTHYQDADERANDLIEARIAFDKKYNIEYIPKKLMSHNDKVTYKVTNKAGEIIENAKLILATSRPETDKFDQKLETTTFSEGLYTFNGLEFTKAGVWNLVLKVSIGDDYRFYNIKADTRNANAYEY